MHIKLEKLIFEFVQKILKFISLIFGPGRVPEYLITYYHIQKIFNTLNINYLWEKNNKFLH